MLVYQDTKIPGLPGYSETKILLSSVMSVMSTITFPLLRNCDYVVVSVSIDFPVNSKQDAPFHRIAYDYSHADWDSLCDHFRNVPWEEHLIYL